MLQQAVDLCLDQQSVVLPLFEKGMGWILLKHPQLLSTLLPVCQFFPRHLAQPFEPFLAEMFQILAVSFDSFSKK